MNERGDMAAALLAVTALLVAIVAGALAWMAYDRTGANLDQRIQDQINQSAQNLRESTEGNTTTPADGTGGTSEENMTDDTNTDTDTVPQTQP